MKAPDEAAGRELRDAIRTMLGELPGKLYRDRAKFLEVLEAACSEAEVKLAAPVKKAILAGLSERDEGAEICRDSDGNPEFDPQLRDYEIVPLKESVRDFFEREVAPHVPDAWINESVRDEKDGEIGKVGYEINFNRYFYIYEPPRPLEEIEADIKTVEQEIFTLLGGVTRYGQL